MNNSGLIRVYYTERNRKQSSTLKNEKSMDKYICTVCEYIYDPELGDPENGIQPGTAFEDLPDDWVCPLCGVGKEDFEVTHRFKRDKGKAS